MARGSTFPQVLAATALFAVATLLGLSLLGHRFDDHDAKAQLLYLHRQRAAAFEEEQTNMYQNLKVPDHAIFGSTQVHRGVH